MYLFSGVKIIFSLQPFPKVFDVENQKIVDWPHIQGFFGHEIPFVKIMLRWYIFI
jgi:hypothetical protein